jgi:hypothetical protein
MSEYPNDSRGQTMMTYLPDYYQNSRVMRSIMETEGIEFDALGNALALVLSQFFVRTSDDLGLTLWETELNLPPYPMVMDEQKFISQRRRRIISKFKGYGTATVPVLEKVAEGYENGQIKVTEDFANYCIIIKFIDPLGIPANLIELYKTLRDLTPAHLDIKFESNNRFLWDELDAKMWNWNYLDNLKVDWNYLEVLE